MLRRADSPGFPDRDAPGLPAGHSLEMLDDRPLQILVAKARKEPIRGSVPVQRAPIVPEPCKRPKHVARAVPKVGVRVASRGMDGHTSVA